MRFIFNKRKFKAKEKKHFKAVRFLKIVVPLYQQTSLLKLATLPCPQTASQKIFFKVDIEFTGVKIICSLFN